jgi:hypothetical protein
MSMSSDLTVRDHMTFGRCSEGMKIIAAIQNCQDENGRLSRGLSDLNQRIERNIQRVMDEYDLTLGEWHYWCKQARA